MVRSQSLQRSCDRWELVIFCRTPAGELPLPHVCSDASRTVWVMWVVTALMLEALGFEDEFPFAFGPDGDVSILLTFL